MTFTFVQARYGAAYSANSLYYTHHLCHISLDCFVVVAVTAAIATSVSVPAAAALPMLLFVP